MAAFERLTNLYARPSILRFSGIIAAACAAAVFGRPAERPIVVKYGGNQSRAS